MNKKILKFSIIGIVVVLMAVFLFLIYKNIFASSNGNRFENIEKYKLTSEEKKEVKNVFTENENVKSAKVYANNKIINIMITLEDDIDFDEIKSLANSCLENFSEDNLKFYDVQIFVKSLNKESETYPKIGYKFKEKVEFMW